MKKMNIYYLLAIACTVGTMIFSYFAAQKDSSVAENKLKQTISDQTNEITSLRAVIANISNSTDALTAKGSFPTAFLGGGDEQGNSQLLLFLKGKYAIPNLTVKVIDIPNYKQVSGLDMRVAGIDMTPTRKEYPVYEYKSLRPSETPYIMVPTINKETAIILYYKSDNNSWTQNIRIVKTKKGRQFFTTTHNAEGKLLEKQISPDFPLTADGEIILWSNEKKSFDNVM